MAEGFPPFTLVTASSEASFDGLNEPAPGSIHPGGRRDQTVPVGAREIDSLSFLLSAETEMETEVAARIFTGKSGEATGRLLVENRLPWKGSGSRWVDWLVRLSPMSGIKMGGFIRVELDLPPGLGWVRARSGEELFPGGGPDADDAGSRPAAAHCFRVEPPQPCFWPANVLPADGSIKRFTGLWKSDPAQPLPQWLELSWKDAVELRELEIQFPDTEECSTAHAIEVTSAAGDRREIKATGNAACRVAHRVEPPVMADAVRITFYATRGGEAVAVREINCRS